MALYWAQVSSVIGRRVSLPKNRIADEVCGLRIKSVMITVANVC